MRAYVNLIACVRSLRTRTCLSGSVSMLLLLLPCANAQDAHVMHSAHTQHQHAATAGGPERYRRSVHHYSIPEVTLIDSDGAEVFLPDALDSGSPTMVNFIFTSCTTICPVMSVTFSQSREALEAERDDVKMISISIDPEHDTPKRLHEYALQFKAGAKWRFLTGNVSDILTVQKAFDAYRGTKMSHQPFTLMRVSIDKPWIRLDGFASAADLVAEYRRAASP